MGEGASTPPTTSIYALGRKTGSQRLGDDRNAQFLPLPQRKIQKSLACRIWKSRSIFFKTMEDLVNTALNIFTYLPFLWPRPSLWPLNSDLRGPAGIDSSVTSNIILLVYLNANAITIIIMEFHELKWKKNEDKLFIGRK